MSKVQANGTHAKEIAIHFLQATNQRTTSQIVAKTINQAKALLKAKYTKEEIIDVIDYIVEHKDVQMYSLGYINASINDMLREIKELRDAEELKLLKEEADRLASTTTTNRKEVVTDVESAKRNREKSQRFGIQSRLRKKFNFDLFEE